MFGAYVYTYEAQGPICVDGHILDMGIPTQITAYLQSEVFDMIYLVKDLVVNDVRVFRFLDWEMR